MSEVRDGGSPSGIYAAAGRQWHFICGFDFAVLGGLWGVIVGPFWAGDGPLRAV